MSYTNVYSIIKHLEGEEISKDEEKVIDRYAQYLDNFSAMNELAKVLKEKR